MNNTEKELISITTETTPLTRTLSKQELIDAFKTKYVKEFGAMDDRAYFISGILLDVIEELFKTP